MDGLLRSTTCAETRSARLDSSEHVPSAWFVVIKFGILMRLALSDDVPHGVVRDEDLEGGNHATVHPGTIRSAMTAPSEDPSWTLI